ncbi:MAG: glycosyltransferase family A protein [Pseudomonadota bacterium]
MVSSAPEISVIVPHLNQPAELASCLASLTAQAGAPRFDVTVVDNGSTELPEDVIARFPFAQLLVEPTPGPGPARNRGVAGSQGTLLAFIDADCHADPGWLATIRRELDDDGAPLILGGDVRIPRVDAGQTTMLEAYESIYAYRMDRYIREQGFTGTGNLAVRRRDFERVGPFAGIGVAEDRDWGRRAGALDIPIAYVAEMRIWHPARTDFQGIFAKWDRQIGHDFADLRPGGMARVRWYAKALAMFGSPLAELPRILGSDRVSGLEERLLAFLALVRIRFYRARRMLTVRRSGDAAALSGGWNRPPSGPPD